ncbi:MAG: DUF1460 domain-containing protein [Ignavibacterium sp.]
MDSYGGLPNSIRTSKIITDKNKNDFVALKEDSSSTPICSAKDIEIINSVFSLAEEKKLMEKSISEIIVEVGKYFLGTAYEAFTLEKPDNEQLIINLTGLDCTTYLESCLAFAQCIKQDKTSFEDYSNELTKIRYRNGIINQYPSRLHYFSDWIYANEKKGIVKDITKELGGEPIKFNVSFMSTHPENYKHLKNNPQFIPVIKQQENEINERQYFYIPKEKVSLIEDKIQNGDLIAITTNLEGLDIGHIGIAVKMEDGRIHFMHAPLVGSKVQISQKPLSEYLHGIKKHTGIIVLKVENILK